MTVRVVFGGEWPSWVGPLLEALELVDSTLDLSLQPDAAAAPPVAGAIGVVTDTRRLAHPEHRASLLDALVPWREGGAGLVVPTATAAADLAQALDPLPVRAAPLPLPWPRRVPEAAYDPAGPIVLVGSIDYALALDAIAAARLAGVRRPIVVSGPHAGTYARLGGEGARWLLEPGHDIVAVSDWRDAVDGASLLLVTDGTDGEGAVLREGLATGLPLVCVDGPFTQDHLAASGARCVLALPRPVALGQAIVAALQQERPRALATAARAAVQAESWAPAAAAVAVVARPAAVSGPGRARAHRVVIANLHASGGGGERFVRELAAGLAAAAPSTAFTLVAVTTPGTAFALGGDDLEQRGVEVVAAAPEQLYATLAEQTADADLVHVAWPHLAEVPDIAAPLVCTFHDANWRHFDTYSAAQKEAADRQTAAWVARTDRFVCSSQFIRGELTRLFGARPDRVAVVPLTAEAAAAPVTEAERREVATRYALPPTFVLSPHGNHVHKNYPVLAGALEELRAAGRPVTVVATGAGTAAFQGPDLLGLGYVTGRELTVLYDLAAGMVQTTLYEAGSFPMWEAMLAGIPVACSAIPPLLEQLERQATTAETFDPADRAAVAAALTRLVGPRDAGTIERNRQIVGQRTFRDVAAGYLDVFRTVAGAELR